MQYCTALRTVLHLAVCALVPIAAGATVGHAGPVPSGGTGVPAHGGTPHRIVESLPLHVLQSPQDRSIQYLQSPVVSARGDTLYGINYMLGSIEIWEVGSGALLGSMVLPDSIRALYRSAIDDSLWMSIEEQGFNPARFLSLAVAGDNLYGLVSLLAGHTPIQIPVLDENGDSTVKTWTQWKMKQVVLRISGGVVREVIPLPDTFLYGSLVADSRGYIGGLGAEPRAHTDTTTADSSVVLTLLRRAGGAGTLLPAGAWKAAAGTSGALAGLAPDGALWYCEPSTRHFFVVDAAGRTTPVAPQGCLLDCGGLTGTFNVPTIANYGEGPQHTYRLSSMATGSNRITLLLKHADPDARQPAVLQTYDASGTFLGEEILDVPVVRDAQTAWLMEVRDGKALLLIETPDQRWRLERLVLSVY